MWTQNVDLDDGGFNQHVAITSSSFCVSGPTVDPIPHSPTVEAIVKWARNNKTSSFFLTEKRPGIRKLVQSVQEAPMQICLNEYIYIHIYIYILNAK